MAITKADLDRAIKTLTELFAQRPEAQASTRGRTPDSTLAAVRDWGCDMVPDGRGGVRLVRLRRDTGPLPRWLVRHLVEDWDAIRSIVNAR